MPPSADPPPREQPQALLLTQRQDRFVATEAALARLRPCWLLERAATAPQAAELALRGGLQLLLIDAAALHDGGAGLVHHLARWCPALPLRVVIDSGASRPAVARALHWPQLEAELQVLLGPVGRPD